MKVAFTPNAREDLNRRFAYTAENFGKSVADRIFRRLDAFIHGTLAHFPMTGRPHPSGNFFETWVPRTPFFLIYSVDTAADVLTVLAVFHHAQDRSAFDPDAGPS
jgi:plasmid stabilization system protein ParE